MFAINTEDTVLKFKFYLCFKDQTESWIRIVSDIDKFVREPMPIQEEEKASVETAAKARPILKPSSINGWDFTSHGTERMDCHLEYKNPRIFVLFKCVKIHYWITSTQSKKPIEKKVQESITSTLL